ncbi:SMC5-SMC6 complex localization factor protein 1 isoform X5 [Hydra vulgaris]|uniref:SMC5-SMC6 complex localization factor protein 1 isoform X5 n=1 Tax=Hydra vulgaris TaxID=6087 RepID=A0ABM4CN59_HYDVU
MPFDINLKKFLTAMADKTTIKSKEIVFIFCSFNESEKDSLIQKINSIPGGVYLEAQYYKSICNIIVCKSPNQNEIYLCGCLAGKTIVTPRYITDSYALGEWVEEKPYEWYRQPLQIGTNEDLVKLPLRCREYERLHGGKHLLSNWKVLLCIKNSNWKKGYQRLLEAGGAIIINSIGYQDTITHAFVTPDSLNDPSLKKLNSEIILQPCYITDYIVKRNIKNVKKYQLLQKPDQLPAKIYSPKKPYFTCNSSNQKTIIDFFNKKRKLSDDVRIPSHNKQQACDSHIQLHKKFDLFGSTNLKFLPQCSDNKGTIFKDDVKVFDCNTKKLFNSDNVIEISSDEDDIVSVNNNDFTNKLSLTQSTAADVNKPHTFLTQNVATSVNKPHNFPTQNIATRVSKSHTFLAVEFLNNSFEPIVPLPLLNQEIEDLKKWLQINIIDKIITEVVQIYSCNHTSDSNDTLDHNITSDHKNSLDNNNKLDHNGSSDNKNALYSINTPIYNVASYNSKTSVYNVTSDNKNTLDHSVISEYNITFSSNDTSENNITSPNHHNTSIEIVEKCSPESKQEKILDIHTNLNLQEIEIASLSLIPDIDFIRKTRKMTSQITKRTINSKTMPHLTLNENSQSAENIFRKDVHINYPNNFVLHEKTEFRGSTYLLRSLFPSRIESLVESYIEEGSLKNAITIVKENLSGFYYPSASLISRILIIYSHETNVSISTDASCVLLNILLLHPISKIPDVYDLALQKPTQDKLGSVSGTVTSWQFVLEIFTNATNCIQSETDESLWELKLQPVRFITLMMERDLFHVFPYGFENSATSKSLENLRKLLVWRVFWQNSTEININSNVKDLLHLVFHLVISNQVMQERMILKESLIILSLVARCCLISDMIKYTTFFGRMCFNLIHEIQSKCDQNISSNISFKLLESFFPYLQPNWLSGRIIDYMLQRYDCSFVMKKDLLKSPLSMEKIITCYFFLYPRPYFEQCASISNNNKITSCTSGAAKNINKKNKKGETALHIACIRNHPDRVKELISNGANPNIRDNAGWYPLHEASIHGHVQCLNALLSYKDLDLCATNYDGISALHDAVENNRLEVAQILLHVGGHRLISLQTKDNKTALDMAKTKEMKSLLNRYNINSLSTSVCEINDKLYKNVKLVSNDDLQKYLFLLILLIESLKSSEELGITKSLLTQQFNLLKQHIALISDKKTIKVAMLLKKLEKVLEINYF